MVTQVVSLVPSVTETLLAWGIEPVAVTRFCEQPGLRAVGGTKNPDIDAIAALAPDIVVMDREENNLADADALRALGINLHVTHVRAVTDVTPTLVALAEAVGAPQPPPVSVPGTLSGHRPRVWVPIWRRPWMSINAATYGSSILATAGIDNVTGDEKQTYPITSLDAAVTAHPDAVLAPSEPYAFVERHRAELEVVAPVVFVDGKDLFWWGVRTEPALRHLAELRADLISRGN